MEEILRQFLSSSNHSLKDSPFPMIPLSFDTSIMSPTECQQPKPQHSYIGLIAMAILSSPQKKMVLAEVYEWIMNEYPYFRSRGAGWRNSIRHNLSLNDCFVKAGRAANGKGHYWAVHPACVKDFERGDFRRRRAQRKVRRHMGLQVEDGDSSDEEGSPGSDPSPPIFPTALWNFNCAPRAPIKSFTIEAILEHH
ncbi:Fork-head domain-containing protein [Caenorhabditis elegans]|uniref:Fork-head domain-containing protein n=1 Tax=Caenorhabditis elegans TaxID=6239 RepID=O17593_CAEEL|nr:Fork-head domain-containing protein [Caenorhabditis elegans]CAB02761.2 Fork-head domain-containing protein [Caenorhabditis elegans]|eukprot:NP_492676.2 ForKHead transcription factor family [Caenorhabditis elegans]